MSGEVIDPCERPSTGRALKEALAGRLLRLLLLR